MSDNILEVKNVTKIFSFNKRKGIFNKIKNLRTENSQKGNIRIKHEQKTLIALDNVSFTAKKGEILGIIGLNGSGKSTLLQVIAGIYQPDSGSVQVNGTLAPILGLGTGFNQELVPSENIVMYGMLFGFKKNEIVKRIPKILEFAELEQFSTMKLKHFSSGMRARLAFSTMLELNPDILLVDEILSVGDINFKQKSTKAFFSFKEKGKTILITTHQLGILNDLADRVILLHHGKIAYVGEPNEVIQKYQEIIKSEKDFKT